MKKLPRRWFELPEKVKNHTEIQRLKVDLLSGKYLNYVIVAGRRSFKTETIKRYIIHKSIKTPNQTYLVGSPTTAQTKRIWWQDLIDLLPEDFVKKISIMEQTITLINDTKLILFSGEASSRVEGIMINGAIVDEATFLSEDVYLQTLEPMLNDNEGFFIVLSRPTGKNFLYDLFERGKSGLFSDWQSYHWSAEDILSEKQIESAKANLDEATYKQQYLASFGSLTSLPYYAFSDANKDYTIRYRPEAKELLVFCDFNASEKPMVWCLAQEVGNRIEIFDMLSHQFINTEETSKILLHKLNIMGFNKNKRITFFGDYSGTKMTSNSSVSDWMIIQDKFKMYNVKFEIKPVKSIRDTVAATNALLMNAKGEHRLFVNPTTCSNLVNDWIRCEWIKDGMDVSQNDIIGHGNRAVDYYSHYRHPIQGNNKTTII